MSKTWLSRSNRKERVILITEFFKSPPGTIKIGSPGKSHKKWTVENLQKQNSDGKLQRFSRFYYKIFKIDIITNLLQNFWSQYNYKIMAINQRRRILKKYLKSSCKLPVICRLKPFCVKYLKENDQDTCSCIIHVNFELIINCMKWKLLTTTHQVIRWKHYVVTSTTKGVFLDSAICATRKNSK